MVFSSPVFLFLFLPLVLLGNFLLPRLWMRNLFLLSASLLFYAWGEQFFVLVMVGSILLNYGFGLLVHALGERPRAARAAVAAAVILNLLLLIAFKYASFLVANLNLALAGLGRPPVELSPIHLPIGISFFTFHALSYVVDVYRKDGRVQRSPLNMGLYISLFPQLIAGPIVRYRDVCGQLHDRVVSLPGFASGIRRFTVGLGKKIILANSFAVVADKAFNLDPAQLTTGLAWLGAVSYALQIFFDFSGYSDMALGLGRMLGFTFRENFDFPYVSTSIREFWRRWHISLSTWFRDYLYIPIGGNRGSALRTGLNLVTVFFLCGLWHGASWTFVVWGLYHGAFLVLERTAWGRAVDRAWRPLRHAYALLVVLVGWVFFRADTLGHAGSFLAAMAGGAAGAGIEWHAGMFWNAQFALTLGAAALASTPVWPALNAWWTRSFRPGPSAMATRVIASAAIDFVFVPAILVFCAMLLARGSYNPFIYFRF